MITTRPARPDDSAEWLQLRLEYDTRNGEDGWINDVTFEWTVGVIMPRGKPVVMRYHDQVDSQGKIVWIGTPLYIFAEDHQDDLAVQSPLGARLQRL